MHHPTGKITHTTAFVTPVVDHWLEREIAQWVHHEGSIQWPIAPWVNARITELHLAPIYLMHSTKLLLMLIKSHKNTSSITKYLIVMCQHSHCVVVMCQHSHCVVVMCQHSHCVVVMCQHSHCVVVMCQHSHCVVVMSTQPLCCSNVSTQPLYYSNVSTQPLCCSNVSTQPLCCSNVSTQPVL